MSSFLHHMEDRGRTLVLHGEVTELNYMSVLEQTQDPYPHIHMWNDGDYALIKYPVYSTVQLVGQWTLAGITSTVSRVVT